MNQKTGIIIGAIVVVLALGGFGYWFVLGEPEAPSAPIEAIPLDPPTEVAEAEVVEPEPIDVPEEAEEPEVLPTEPPVEPTSEPTAVAEAVEEAVATAITWGIDSEQSTARFELDEDLNGERITVVGVADQVAGQMRFNAADLSTAEIGTIQVNARTFATDNDRRNNAIQNRILQTGDYEFVTFEPTNIVGMPATAAVGGTVQFDIEGNLTIRDVTLPVTFSAIVDLIDTNTIEGTVATIIAYSDFGINVPQVPVIANVEEELEIYIDFRANPVE
ncbi:MAG: YceI family protein [Anaerolineae bacterium]